MHPGGDCISCHTQRHGPTLTIAGTVYASGHEPTDCNGASGATVIVTDAAGQMLSIATNPAGNFYYRGALTPPFHAVVVYQGRTRAMSSAQTSGDCNSCHTESGANGAPGRIALP